MKSKASLISTLAVFLLIIFGFALCGLFQPDGAVSSSERRKLQQMKAPTVESVMNGKWFQGFDKYASDQFPLRDGFRGISAQTRLNLMLQKDNKGLYVENGVVFKSDYPLVPSNIENFAAKTNQVYENYIAGKAGHYWVSVIPDKGHFDVSDHLVTDAKAVADIFVRDLRDAEYIDIFPGLSLDSYYRTDTHWSQDKLFQVMELLGKDMGFTPPEIGDYTAKSLSPFYGVYWGQSALNPQPDTLTYLTNAVIEAAIVENTDKPQMTHVYDREAFSSEDSYNLFLSGGTPLTTVTSPLSRTDKELVIFRDSFGSSIGPLFLEEYRKVTLVDLRYFAASLLPDYVDFEGADVLVLYSSLILNSNILLK